MLPAHSRIPSSASSCAKAVSLLAGLADRCGRVCEGSFSNLLQTASSTLGLDNICTGLTKTRLDIADKLLSPCIIASTTIFTVFLLNLGKRQSTAFSFSLLGILRANGERIIRPNSCVICVSSLADLNEIITSALGQSQPELIASLAIRIRIQVES